MMKEIPEMFGSLVFGDAVMQQRLPKETYKALNRTIAQGRSLDPSVANVVANAMKDWAIEKGATHFTHWFQPMTGVTAEKHDSFISPTSDGRVIMEFSGKELVKGEPDASSFPSGGLRATFEARGYTAWDPTSYAFIKDNTLCIPTAFSAYTGEALDEKTPLLRSMEAINKQALRILKLFGHTDVTRVLTSIGCEQEYFLIDQDLYEKRKDLRFTGRTLFGAKPPKGQELDDHYFGAINPRVKAFMEELDDELWKLGISAKTEHKEVAPGQHELAPVYTTSNIAADQNQLTMEMMKKVAERHGLVCLLHEKPFAGINGSGKHNNWSVAYGKNNLLNPGNDPHQNAIFLTVLTAIIEAVNLHSDLLRAAVTGAGNDHRLGANEAPPAIISMYLGDQLADVIDQLEKGAPTSSRHPGAMKIGADTLPPLPRDATDRNRTSPFAFTGNKFEFRAPGSSQSCSGPNTILNTIVAEAFDRMSDVLENLKKDEFNSGLQKHLQKVIRANKRIIFNGDGYTEEWLKEAEKRGLPNAKTTMEALRCLTAPENIAMLEKYGVYNRRELESRFEVFLEEYHRRIRIEGEIALEIAASMIAPVVTAEYGKAARALAAAKEAGLTTGLAALQKSAAGLGAGLDELNAKLDALRTALGGLHEEIIAAMAELRHTVDSLERLVADECWPLPKYREMLFVY